MKLQKVNIYEYLKETETHSFQKSYFLGNQKTFKENNIQFPIRTHTYAITVIYKGNEKLFKVGSRDYYVQAKSLITIGPEIVCNWIGDYNNDQDTIFFTENLFKDYVNLSFLKSLNSFKLEGKHVINISDSDLEKFRSLFHTLKLVIDNQAIVTGIVYSMLMLAKQCHSNSISSHTASFRNETLVINFKKLITKHFLKHKEISFYANELNISPKYLSQLLLKHTGKTAKKIISEYIILESKSLLRQTDMSIKEISHQLGFQDASYFSKFFKKNEGNSPYKYRNA